MSRENLRGVISGLPKTLIDTPVTPDAQPLMEVKPSDFKPCARCNGTGKVDGKQCVLCQAKGTMLHRPVPESKSILSEVCQACGGHGAQGLKTCVICQGEPFMVNFTNEAVDPLCSCRHPFSKHTSRPGDIAGHAGACTSNPTIPPKPGFGCRCQYFSLKPNEPDPWTIEKQFHEAVLPHKYDVSCQCGWSCVGKHSVLSDATECAYHHEGSGSGHNCEIEDKGTGLTFNSMGSITDYYESAEPPDTQPELTCKKCDKRFSPDDAEWKAAQRGDPFVCAECKAKKKTNEAVNEMADAIKAKIKAQLQGKYPDDVLKKALARTERWQKAAYGSKDWSSHQDESGYDNLVGTVELYADEITKEQAGKTGPTANQSQFGIWSPNVRNRKGEAEGTSYKGFWLDQDSSNPHTGYPGGMWYALTKSGVPVTDGAPSIEALKKEIDKIVAHGADANRCPCCETVEKVLYGVKNGDEDWQEQLLLSGPNATDANIEKVKQLAAKDGFGKFRVASIDLSKPPDFTKALRKNEADDHCRVRGTDGETRICGERKPCPLHDDEGRKGEANSYRHPKTGQFDAKEGDCWACEGSGTKEDGQGRCAMCDGGKKLPNQGNNLKRNEGRDYSAKVTGPSAVALKRLATEAAKHQLTSEQQGAVNMVQRDTVSILARPKLALEIKMVLDFAILHQPLKQGESDDRCGYCGHTPVAHDPKMSLGSGLCTGGLGCDCRQFQKGSAWVEATGTAMVAGAEPQADVAFKGDDLKGDSDYGDRDEDWSITNTTDLPRNEGTVDDLPVNIKRMWKNDEFHCPICDLSIGKNLLGDIPHALAAQHLSQAHPGDKASILAGNFEPKMGSAASYIKMEAEDKKIVFKCQECGKKLPGTARKCSKCGSEDIDLAEAYMDNTKCETCDHASRLHNEGEGRCFAEVNDEGGGTDCRCKKFVRGKNEAGDYCPKCDHAMKDHSANGCEVCADHGEKCNVVDEANTWLMARSSSQPKLAEPTFTHADAIEAWQNFRMPADIERRKQLQKFWLQQHQDFSVGGSQFNDPDAEAHRYYYKLLLQTLGVKVAEEVTRWTETTSGSVHRPGIDTYTGYSEMNEAMQCFCGHSKTAHEDGVGKCSSSGNTSAGACLCKSYRNRPVKEAFPNDGPGEDMGTDMPEMGDDEWTRNVITGDGTGSTVGVEDKNEAEELRWKAGDIVIIRSHNSEPGHGLSYSAAAIVAFEDGVAGGWDVYDGASLDAPTLETSFYGFSVLRVRRGTAGKNEAEEVTSPLNTYLAVHSKKGKIQLKAATTYQAQQLAAKQMGVPKPFEISIHLIGKADGTPVPVHVESTNTTPYVKPLQAFSYRVGQKYDSAYNSKLAQAVGRIVVPASHIFEPDSVADANDCDLYTTMIALRLKELGYLLLSPQDKAEWETLSTKFMQDVQAYAGHYDKHESIAPDDGTRISSDWGDIWGDPTKSGITPRHETAEAVLASISLLQSAFVEGVETLTMCHNCGHAEHFHLLGAALGAQGFADNSTACYVDGCTCGMFTA